MIKNLYQYKTYLKNLPFRIAVVFLFCATATLLSGMVMAENGNGDMETLRNTNYFFAYVNTGEEVDINFERVKIGSGSNASDVTVTVDKPGSSSSLSCSIPAGQPVGSSCAWLNEEADESGIWRIGFEVPSQTTEYHTWEIVVKDNSNPILGRVWSNAYYINQSGGSVSQASNSPDIKIWYKSEIGYLYEVDYLEYFGIDSVFQANSFGLVEEGTCSTLYKSLPVDRKEDGGVNPDSVVQDCGGEYKVFFEQPSPDLPERARQWNGEEDWISVSVVDPVIENVHFIPDSSDSLSGVLKFSTKNYVGSAKVVAKVLKGDGGHQPERSFAVGAPLNKEIELYFDGKDDSGKKIPLNHTLKFDISLERVGEIHFVNTDPEKRAGGIQVMRHTGAQEGRSIVYWDDTDFSGTVSTRCSVTPELSGLAGVDSTGGVHGWGIDGCSNNGNANNPDDSASTGSWGDARYIHDWTYAPSPVVNASYTYLPDVYVECVTEIGSPCTTEIPEFCQNTLTIEPSHGTSKVSGKKVTYTPDGNNADEENYIYLRESGGSEARCFVKINFIPKGSNTGLTAMGGQRGMMAAGAGGIGILGFAARRRGAYKLFSFLGRR